MNNNSISGCAFFFLPWKSEHLVSRNPSTQIRTNYWTLPNRQGKKNRCPAKEANSDPGAFENLSSDPQTWFLDMWRDHPQWTKQVKNRVLKFKPFSKPGLNFVNNVSIILPGSWTCEGAIPSGPNKFKTGF